MRRGGISGRRLAGAVAGGLAAGLGLTAMLMMQEKKERQAVGADRLGTQYRGEAGTGDTACRPASRCTRAGSDPERASCTLRAGGATYSFATDEDADVIPSGIAFGLAFYAAAHWIAGPALGVKAPEWKSDASTIGMHTINHVLFGLITAGAAKVASNS